VEQCQAVCQRLSGQNIDAAIGRVLVESVSPLALEVVWSVQTALQAQVAEADRVRRQHVERAQYEADQARLRFMRVDPNNPLVADTLETQWNEKLQTLARAKEEYEKQRQQDEVQMTAEQRAKVLALTSDFPRLWQDARTLARDRKRMVRLLIEDVTLTRGEEILMQIRFKGGATRELRLPMSQPAWALRKTSVEVVALVDQLLQDFDDPEVARELNARGLLSGTRRPFNAGIIKHLRQSYGFKSRQERLCEKGWLTAAQIALLIDEDPRSVYKWRARGLLEAVRCGHRNDNVYQRPSDEVIAQIQRRKRPVARKTHPEAESTRLSAV